MFFERRLAKELCIELLKEKIERESIPNVSYEDERNIIVSVNGLGLVFDKTNKESMEKLRNTTAICPDGHLYNLYNKCSSLV